LAVESRKGTLLSAAAWISRNADGMSITSIGMPRTQYTLRERQSVGKELLANKSDISLIANVRFSAKLSAGRRRVALHRNL
jgi:hypothetical protein